MNRAPFRLRGGMFAGLGLPAAGCLLAAGLALAVPAARAGEAGPRSGTGDAGAAPADTGAAWTTFPVPDGGILYLRYGRPGGVVIRRRHGVASPKAPAAAEAPAPEDSLIAVIRQVLREELARIPRPAPPAAAVVLPGTPTAGTAASPSTGTRSPRAAPPPGATPTPPAEATPPPGATPTPPAEATPPPGATPAPPAEAAPPPAGKSALGEAPEAQTPPTATAAGASGDTATAAGASGDTATAAGAPPSPAPLFPPPRPRRWCAGRS